MKFPLETFVKLISDGPKSTIVSNGMTIFTIPNIMLSSQTAIFLHRSALLYGHITLALFFVSSVRQSSVSVILSRIPDFKMLTLSGEGLLGLRHFKKLYGSFLFQFNNKIWHIISLTSELNNFTKVSYLWK